MLHSITHVLHMTMVGNGFGIMGSWVMAPGTIVRNNCGIMGSWDLARGEACNVAGVQCSNVSASSCIPSSPGLFFPLCALFFAVGSGIYVYS